MSTIYEMDGLEIVSWSRGIEIGIEYDEGHWSYVEFLGTDIPAIIEALTEHADYSEED